MPPKLLTTDRTAMASALLAQWTAASGPSVIEFYTAPQPASPATAITTQTLLGTITCSDPLGAVSGGIITFGPIGQENAADASGVASWARQRDGAGVARADWPVSDEAGNGVIRLNTTSIEADGPILISSFAVEIPGA